MRIVSVVNTKGGVGKTTVCVGVAEALASVYGKRVLVVDLDPQASASFALVGESRFDDMRHSRRHVLAFLEDADLARRRPSASGEPAGPGLAAVVEREASALSPRPRLDLLGAVPELQGYERKLVYDMASRAVRFEEMGERVAAHFRACLGAVADSYDVVVFDCPPGVSTFAEAAIRASDAVLAPVVLEYLPVMGLEVFLRRVVRPLRAAAHYRGAALAMYNRVQSLKEEQIYAEQVRAWARSPQPLVQVMETRLPQMPDVARACQPVGRLAGLSFEGKYARASVLFKDLAEELLFEVEKRTAA